MSFCFKENRGRTLSLQAIYALPGSSFMVFGTAAGLIGAPCLFELEIFKETDGQVLKKYGWKLS